MKKVMERVHEENMIRSLFFGMQEANKLAGRPKDVATQTFTKIGMLGAGMMGAGIAMSAATAGIALVLGVLFGTGALLFGRTGEGIGWLAQSGAVPLGYLGDAEKTARTFPTIEGVRYSVPGDRAIRRGETEIDLLGRDSQCINSGGEKIIVEALGA